MTATSIEPVELTEVQKAANGYQLVAIDQAQLSTAHGQMVEWAQQQQHLCNMERAEETENLNVAVKQKWATAPFRKRIAILDRRLEFYQKIRTALELGFVIVPNFEMSVFAIRTTAEHPQPQSTDLTWGRPNFTEPVQTLPEGEGEYQNPSVGAHHYQTTIPDGEGKTRAATHHYSFGEFKDITFPIALAKPTLMSKTAQALAAKVFDEVGVAVDSGRERWRGARAGDPIILGRIRNPRDNRPDMTFFIGWYFDPSRI